MSVPPYLTLISEVMPVIRRDFSLTDPTILNPAATNPLFDGEWLELDTSYLAKRKSSGESTQLSFQVFSLKGQYDTQAIGKATLLFLGGYEAETSIVTMGSIQVGDYLVVDDVTIGVAKRGLIEAAGSGQHLIHGICTKVVGTTKIRYWHQGVFQITI